MSCVSEQLREKVEEYIQSVDGHIVWDSWLNRIEGWSSIDREMLFACIGDNTFDADEGEGEGDDIIQWDKVWNDYESSAKASS